MTSFSYSSSKARGFTLTEVAIVLGVIGLIISAIWASASNVYKNKKLTEAQREIMVISQNIRKLYTGRGSLNCTTTTDITGPMVTAGVFPADMIVAGKTYPQSPWLTDVRVYSCSDASTGDNSLFQIEYMPTMNINQCSPLLARTVGPSQDPNLQYVSGVAGTWLSTSGGTAYDVTSFAGCTLAAFTFRL